jgi:hypothetical protein
MLYPFFGLQVEMNNITREFDVEPLGLNIKTISPWKENRFSLAHRTRAISTYRLHIYLFLFSIFDLGFIHVYVFFHFCCTYTILPGESISAENGTISPSIDPIVHCWCNYVIFKYPNIEMKTFTWVSTEILFTYSYGYRFRVSFFGSGTLTSRYDTINIIFLLKTF